MLSNHHVICFCTKHLTEGHVSIRTNFYESADLTYILRGGDWIIGFVVETLFNSEGMGTDTKYQIVDLLCLPDSDTNNPNMTTDSFNCVVQVCRNNILTNLSENLFL